jgi:hypothetical protein
MPELCREDARHILDYGVRVRLLSLLRDDLHHGTVIDNKTIMRSIWCCTAVGMTEYEKN